MGGITDGAYFDSTLFGLFEPHYGAKELVRHIGQVWFVLGVSGLIFRSIQLCFVRDPLTGLVWATKILTDPFHDIKLYYRAPFYLLRGDMLDEMDEAIALDPHH